MLFEPFKADTCFEFNDFSFFDDLAFKFKGFFAEINNEFVIYLWKVFKTKQVSNNEDDNSIQKIDSANSVLKVHRFLIDKVIYNDKKFF